MGLTLVVKLGGELLVRQDWLDARVVELCALQAAGHRVVLVHGGGAQLDEAAAAAKLETERVAGRRITSPALRDLAVQVWRGGLSAQVAGSFVRAGGLAVGLCGADGGVVKALRRPPVRKVDSSGAERLVDYGEVGDVVGVAPGVLHALLDAGVAPALCSLAVGPEGALLNVNADTVASRVAAALGADVLVFLTSVPGILRDVRDAESLVGRVDLAGLDALVAEGVIAGGMLPKCDAVREAVTGGVGRVVLGDGRVAGLLADLVAGRGRATVVAR